MNALTVESVRQAVADIANICNSTQCDSERCHSMEDELWGDVLTVIAAGHPDARGIAAEAVKTSELDFERWCA